MKSPDPSSTPPDITHEYLSELDQDANIDPNDDEEWVSLPPIRSSSPSNWGKPLATKQPSTSKAYALSSQDMLTGTVSSEDEYWVGLPPTRSSSPSNWGKSLKPLLVKSLEFSYQVDSDLSKNPEPVNK